MLLLAILVPPIYFLFKGKWVGFLITFLLFLLGIYLCSTILLAPLLVIFWIMASTWAISDLRWDLKQQNSNSLQKHKE